MSTLTILMSLVCTLALGATYQLFLEVSPVIFVNFLPLLILAYLIGRVASHSLYELGHNDPVVIVSVSFILVLITWFTSHTVAYVFYVQSLEGLGAATLNGYISQAIEDGWRFNAPRRRSSGDTVMTVTGGGVVFLWIVEFLTIFGVTLSHALKTRDLMLCDECQGWIQNKRSWLRPVFSTATSQRIEHATSNADLLVGPDNQDISLLDEPDQPAQRIYDYSLFQCPTCSSKQYLRISEVKRLTLLSTKPQLDEIFNFFRVILGRDFNSDFKYKILWDGIALDRAEAEKLTDIAASFNLPPHELARRFPPATNQLVLRALLFFLIVAVFVSLTLVTMPSNL